MFGSPGFAVFDDSLSLVGVSEKPIDFYVEIGLVLFDGDVMNKWN